MRRGLGLAIVVMACAVVMVSVIACTASESPVGPSSTATVAGTSTAVAIADVTATPQPPLEALYDPKPYLDSNFSYTTGPTRMPPPGLNAANAEAALWLGSNAFEGEAPAWFLDVPGRDDRQCIELPNDTSRVRSGDFVLDVTRWSGPDPVFELLPVRSSRKPLLLRALYLDDPDAANPATHVHEYDGFMDWNAAGEISYTPRFVLPRAGRWMVVATAGPVWSCFVLEAPTPPVGLEVARSIEEAEAAGAAYASAPVPPAPPAEFTRERGPGVIEHPGAYTVGGTAERACLDAAGIHDARSGEWVMRPASIYGEGWRATLPGTKVLLEPLHQPAAIGPPGSRSSSEERLTLASTLLDDPRHTYVYEQPFFNAGNTPFSHVTTLVHPRRGRWLIVATSGNRGPDWGCFVVEAR